MTLGVSTTEAMHAQLLRHRRVSPNWVSHRVGDTAQHLTYFVPPIWYGPGTGMTVGAPLGPWRSAAARIIAGLANLGARVTIRALTRLGVCASQAGRYNNHTHMMMGILTATEDAWARLLALRLAPDADPAIQLLAQAIAPLIADPVWDIGPLHLPFFDPTLDADLSFEDRLRVCAARIARVSYGQAGRTARDLRLGARLLAQQHWSPFDQLGIWRPRAQLRVNPLCTLPADLDDAGGWVTGRVYFDPTPTLPVQQG